jgi:acyl-CoA thioester hydrolase
MRQRTEASMSSGPALYATIASAPVTEHFLADARLLDERVHVHVRHFFDACSHALLFVTESLGIDGAYRERTDCDGFVAQNDIRYLNEIRLGDRYSTRSQLVRNGQRSFTTRVYLLNDTTARVACTFDATIVHVNLGTRRSAPLPQEAVTRARDRIARDADAFPPLAG